MLMVLFTSRSGQHGGSIQREQLKLLALSAVGLLCGALGLYLLRILCLKALGRATPEAAAMIGPFALTMVFVGLLQSLALWALASRWSKVTLLYGFLGVSYWCALLALGRDAATQLAIMPIATGGAFLLLFIAWLVALRRRQPVG
jgi:hypothetical protein